MAEQIISVLVRIEDKGFQKVYNAAQKMPGKADKSVALGYVVEQLTKSVFAGTGESVTAGGRPDITGIPLTRIAEISNILEDITGGAEGTTATLLGRLKEEATEIDIEAKGTMKLVGRTPKGTPFGPKAKGGVIKVSQARAVPRGQLSNADYRQRAQALILSILEDQVTGKSSAKLISDQIKTLFANYADFDTDTAFLTALETLASGESLQQSLENIIDDKVKQAQFLKGPFSRLVREKMKNLTVQINANVPGGQTYRFFQTFVGLKVGINDVFVKLDKEYLSKSRGTFQPQTLYFYLSAAFEKKLIAETRKKLEAGAVGIVKATVQGGTGQKRVTGIGFGEVTKDLTVFSPAVLDKMGFTIEVPSGGSIPMPSGINVSALFHAIQTKVGEANTKAQSRKKQTRAIGKGKGGRGQFMSNVQLSAILQKRLADTMPRYAEPHRPTPRYVTGRLARSFQISANYRQGIIGFL
jgi:hypothetical protein